MHSVKPKNFLGQDGLGRHWANMEVVEPGASSLPGTKKISIWPKVRLHFPDSGTGLLRWVRHPGAAASQSTALGRITRQRNAEGLQRDREDQRGKNHVKRPPRSRQAGEAFAGGNLGKHPPPNQAL